MTNRFKPRSKTKSSSYGTRYYKSNNQFKKNSSKILRNQTDEPFNDDATEEVFQTSNMMEESKSAMALYEKYALIDAMDLQMGFFTHAGEIPKKGWLINIQTTLLKDPEWINGRSGLQLYFIEDSGNYFKTVYISSPYFYVYSRNFHETTEFLKKRFGNIIEKIEKEEKEDLSLKNHLASNLRIYIKLSFRNVEDMLTVKRPLLSAVLANKKNAGISQDIHSSIIQIKYDTCPVKGRARTLNSGLNGILEIREHDIPYQLRVCIDCNLRAGIWYDVWSTPQTPELQQQTHIIPLVSQPVRPDPVVMAFDIETTKQPLRFPSADSDLIMMISYMIDGSGYLIVNREIISEDIPDFEYSPKEEFKGLFRVTNVPNERELLEHFIAHIQESRPTILVTYNGDSFDWPFVESRCISNNLSLYSMLGILRHGPIIIPEFTSEANTDNEESSKKGPLPYYSSTWASHMDVFKWVKRDSYLPAGSQGLKAVTSIKLGYTPLELDPEEMLPLAYKDPQKLAAYSVSDALCTYHLYMKYVHPFIFSLSSIVPLSPDDILRKGTGTLCETLLMTEAYHAHVIMPDKTLTTENKQILTPDGKHLVDSETYVGGHVEALESGIFRSDLPVKFILDSSLLQQLEAEFKDTILFSLSVEHGISSSEIENIESDIYEYKKMLKFLADTPIVEDKPLIYHLDVAAMYPNIILTNRLQPPSMVNEDHCALCDYNIQGKRCQRSMEWSWRGEYFVAQKNELRMIQNQLSIEQFPKSGGKLVKWNELSLHEQDLIFRQRLTQYCRKIYHRIHSTNIEKRNSIICQKENPFYVDTVRKFRDRRYEYKNLHKDAKRALEKSYLSPAAIEEAQKLIILYDSLQLAHKVLLTDFYLGYS